MFVFVVPAATFPVVAVFPVAVVDFADASVFVALFAVVVAAQ